MTPEEKLACRVAAIESDYLSADSPLVGQAVDVLYDALELGEGVVEQIGFELCRAQPAIAPIWNATALALGSDAKETLQLFRLRMTRAPQSIAKALGHLLLSGAALAHRPTISLATVSQSDSVKASLMALAEFAELRVVCAEGRPTYEGRLMAEELVKAGISVTLCTDAAIGAVVRAASPAVDAVVTSADAVSVDWFLNKCGTHFLTAAAASVGVPVYVLASRSIFLNSILSGVVDGKLGSARQVWSCPPPNLEVVNLYVERIPLDVVSLFVTDTGPIGMGSIPEMCESLVDFESAERTVELTVSRGYRR